MASKSSVLSQLRQQRSAVAGTAPPPRDAASELPAIDEPVETPAAAAAAVARVDLPLGEVPPGVFVSRHVEVQLSREQARAMRRLYEGLMNTNARLASGRRVKSPADAVRFILEQLGTD